MSEPHLRKRVAYATAAFLLAGLSSTIFVSAKGRGHTERAVLLAARPSMQADSTTIERGRYIVKTASCNDCHTPGYAQTGGQVAEQQWLIGDALGWEGPWGTTFPTNLRLFMQELSAEQWLQIARVPSRPPMPWFALRDMTDSDLLAVYHYIRSLGAAGTAVLDYLPPGQRSPNPVVKFPAPPVNSSSK